MSAFFRSALNRDWCGAQAIVLGAVFTALGVNHGWDYR
jgi:hypothetical protein